jgi:hypothetical protein
VLLVVIISDSLVFLPLLNAYAAESLAFPTGDLIAPEIDSPPITEEFSPGQRPIIRATVTDNVGVKSVTIFYRDKGETKFQRKEMTRESDTDEYSATLPEILAPGIEYYIQATDQAGNTLLHGHTFAPLTLNVLTGESTQGGQETVAGASREEASAKPNQGVSKWVWIGLGVLAVGALAGGGDGGTTSGAPEPDTGTVTITGPTP